MYRKTTGIVVSLAVLGTILASACTQTYSQAPLETPTLIPTGLFVSPIPSSQDAMKIVAELGTQTAMARTAQAGGTQNPATPQAATPGPATVEPVTTSEEPAPTAEPAQPGVRPATYTLQAGEFPYCIARRFNVNPDALLAANGITDANVVYPG